MPDKTPTSHDAERSPFIRQLVPDPKRPPKTLLLAGFLGESSEEGHTRLYFDLELTSYVEIPDDAILLKRPMPAGQSPIDGAFVWVRRDADLLRGATGRARQVAGYLEGQVRRDNVPEYGATIDVGRCPTEFAHCPTNVLPCPDPTSYRRGCYMDMPPTNIGVCHTSDFYRCVTSSSPQCHTGVARCPEGIQTAAACVQPNAPTFVGCNTGIPCFVHTAIEPCPTRSPVCYPSVVQICPSVAIWHCVQVTRQPQLCPQSVIPLCPPASVAAGCWQTIACPSLACASFACNPQTIPGDPGFGNFGNFGR
jgi:hypothetical protein